MTIYENHIFDGISSIANCHISSIANCHCVVYAFSGVFKSQEISTVAYRRGEFRRHRCKLSSRELILSFVCFAIQQIEILLQGLLDEDPESDLPDKLLDKIERSKGLEECKEANRKRLQAHIEAAKRRERREKKAAEEEAKKTTDESSSAGTGILSSLGMAIINELQKEREEDPFTLFCLSLSPRLRALPKPVGRELMMRLFKFVTDAESFEEERADKDHTFTAVPFTVEEQVSVCTSLIVIIFYFNF